MDFDHKSGRGKFRSKLQHMIERLRNDILIGTYKPGEFLPSETAFVKQYGLSNKSVRKALDELVAEGLIVKINRVGSKVTEKGSQSAVVKLGVSSSIEDDIVLAKLLEDFGTLHPHVHVKTVTITRSEYASQIKNYLESGLIDAFTLNSLHFQELAESGALELVEPMEADREIYPFLNDVFCHDKEYFAKPIVFSPIVLAYNRAHFREMNVPEPDGSWTWEDALKHAATLSRVKGRHGLYFIMVSSLRWPVFLMQSGEDFKPDRNGKYDIAGSKLLEGIQLSKRVITTQDNYVGFLVEDNKDIMDLFRQGNVSMMLASYMSLNEFKESTLDYDISPAPFLHDPCTMLHAIGASLRRTDQENGAARLLVDYLGSSRAQQIVRQGTVSIPAVRSLNESPIEEPDPINRPPRYALYREIMASYQTRSKLNLSAQSFHLLGKLLKKYWSNLIDEDELCEKIREQL
ncbi:extracellular solute-binding protein [Paenibacillus aurantius]|uniref:Extracellular solute-binding protein n=1 Tax=Paenibacillus aurantius TaxID=2918900 RepID=A0AA96REA9_9BACL|nr:extracellular solute-binding protein [Paenibacillus aurantius]WNQ10677.1 extracellular solute-binding protein [Paenibacillus aurantius]